MNYSIHIYLNNNTISLKFESKEDAVKAYECAIRQLDNEGLRYIEVGDSGYFYRDAFQGMEISDYARIIEGLKLKT